MLTPADQAEHMAFMVRVAGAKKGIELGVFTGYTSLCFAEALPEDGKLIAVDVSKEFTGIAHKYWAEAGVDKKIELRLDGGLKVLQELISDKTTTVVSISPMSTQTSQTIHIISTYWLNSSALVVLSCLIMSSGLERWLIQQ